jgi:hypothetical protein
MFPEIFYRFRVDIVDLFPKNHGFFRKGRVFRAKFPDVPRIFLDALPHLPERQICGKAVENLRRGNML